MITVGSGELIIVNFVVSLVQVLLITERVVLIIIGLEIRGDYSRLRVDYSNLHCDHS